MKGEGIHKSIIAFYELKNKINTENLDLKN
jgi:hypothetical protein